MHVLVICTLAHMKAMDALIKNTQGNRGVIEDVGQNCKKTISN